ncbi:MAG: carboxymuconolactone decarboxylase family protein [Pseudomonadota bacterium]
MSADGLPRLTLEQVEPALRDELAPTVARLGYFGEFFQVFGAVPGAMQTFMSYTKSVKAPLSDAENELLALAVCAALGDNYERIQHERLSARLGFTTEWIAAAEGRAGADANLLSPAETALRALALAVIARHGRDCAAEVAAAGAELGTQKATAALLQITRFITIATLCNSLSLSLPVPSVFDATSDITTSPAK